jgi:hypothetical protein
MELQSVSANCVALWVRRSCDSPALAAALVRTALSGAGLQVWEGMELDVFPGDGGALILARPRSPLTVTPAPWLLPYIDF